MAKEDIGEENKYIEKLPTAHMPWRELFKSSCFLIAQERCKEAHQHRIT